MPGRSRHSASPQPTTERSAEPHSAQGIEGNSFLQDMLRRNPVTGPALSLWDGMGALGGVMNDNDLGEAQGTAGDAATAAGVINDLGGSNMPGVGLIGQVHAFLGASRAVDSIQERGLDPENGFDLFNGAVGTVGSFLGPWGSAAAKTWGIATTGTKYVDKLSEVRAEQVAGPDGDSRGWSDRLADRGSAVDGYVDDALSGVLSEENADRVGDIVGGVATVGQVLTPALHYDLVDSWTGGGLTDAKDTTTGAMSDAWGSVSEFAIAESEKRQSAHNAEEHPLLQGMLHTNPITGPALGIWDGMGALGGLMNDNDLGEAQATAGDAATAAGVLDTVGGSNMPGVGLIGQVHAFLGASRAVDSIQERGLDPENGFDLFNGAVGTVGSLLGPWGSAAATTWGIATTGTKYVDKLSEVKAKEAAGPDGDSRGWSDRLADRGSAVDGYVDDALSGVLSEENADRVGDIVGGVATVGQVLTPALHYDLVDSWTGGGLTNTKDAATGAISDAWGSIFD